MVISEQIFQNNCYMVFPYIFQFSFPEIRALRVLGDVAKWRYIIAFG